MKAKHENEEEKLEKGETELLDSVVFYALLNRKRKYMIPSDQNVFDGLKYSKVMIDTGSQMLAIPFPSELTFDQFWNKYRTYYLSIQKSSIQKSSGMGHISRISLVVQGDTTKSFQIHLGKAKNPITVQNLRFILNYAIAVELLKTDHFKGPSFESLKQYIEMIDKLALIIPSLKETSTKEFVLIGQEILQSFYVVQLRFLTLVLERKSRLFFRPLIIEQQYEDECQKFEKDFKEIYECFDAEGDDNSLFGWSPCYRISDEEFHD